MSLAVHLLGRPRLERRDGQAYRFRSRKSWALLAYLILTDRPQSRSRLAELLFAGADDPLRALRWGLAEIRRGLGDDGEVDGDPVILRTRADVHVDVSVLLHGTWSDAVQLPGLGQDLLEGIAIRDAAAFDSWLLSERRRCAADAEAILHEAALGSMSRGALDKAREYAVRAAALSPLDENHQALLIRLYRRVGDDNAAEQQFAAFARLLDNELGVAPGPAAQAALHESRHRAGDQADEHSVEAIIEAGSAAVAAGAVDAGIQSLRTAVHLADDSAYPTLRASSRLVLAEALIHALGGLDEDGLASLHEADRIALMADDLATVTRARAELGYVDFLRGRYDRAHRWLTDALASGHRSPPIAAKAMCYLGSVESDRANYPQAVALLEEAARLARAEPDPRREAYALSMLGRINMLRGGWDVAAEQLAASIGLAERDHWLGFLPWPQALLGELQLTRGDPESAGQTLAQALARATQLGDPCWEAAAVRGLALVYEHEGDTDRAFGALADARTRCNRYADPYVWLDVYILDAQIELGRRHGHPDTSVWIETMREIASRAGMREMTVRAKIHAAALGDPGDAAAAELLAADIDNPALKALVGRRSMARARAEAAPLTTARLQLEPLRVAHAEEMAPVLADPALHAFIGGTPATLSELRGRYERQIVGHSADGSQDWLNWIVRHRDTGRAVGTVQATVSANDNTRTAEVAWVIGTADQGHGFATEAARAMVTWLREQGVAVVIAHVHPQHAASIAIARNVGLSPTDTVVDGEIRWAG